MEMAKVSFTAEEAYVDKLAIAQAFGKAAKSYDQHAAFQREVGHKLLDKLPQDLSGLRVLDLWLWPAVFLVATSATRR